MPLQFLKLQSGRPCGALPTQLFTALCIPHQVLVMAITCGPVCAKPIIMSENWSTQCSNSLPLTSTGGTAYQATSGRIWYLTSPGCAALPDCDLAKRLHGGSAKYFGSPRGSSPFHGPSRPFSVSLSLSLLSAEAELTSSTREDRRASLSLSRKNSLLLSFCNSPGLLCCRNFSAARARHRCWAAVAEVAVAVAAAACASTLDPSVKRTLEDAVLSRLPAAAGFGSAHSTSHRSCSTPLTCPIYTSISRHTSPVPPWLGASLHRSQTHDDDVTSTRDTRLSPDRPRAARTT